MVSLPDETRLYAATRFSCIAGAFLNLICVTALSMPNDHLHDSIFALSRTIIKLIQWNNTDKSRPYLLANILSISSYSSSEMRPCDNMLLTRIIVALYMTIRSKSSSLILPPPYAGRPHNRSANSSAAFPHGPQRIAHTEDICGLPFYAELVPDVSSTSPSGNGLNRRIFYVFSEVDGSLFRIGDTERRSVRPGF